MAPMVDQRTSGQPGLIAGIVSCVCAALGILVPLLPIFGVLLSIIVVLPVAVAGMVSGLRAYTVGRRTGERLPYLLGLIGTVVCVIATVRVVLPFLQ